MKNKETRQKRGIVPLLSAVAAVLGIATASFVFAVVGGNAGTAQTAQSPAISVPSETNTTTTPSDTPVTEPTVAPSTDPNESTAGSGSTGSNGSGTTGSKPSTGGSTSSGSTGGSGSGSNGGSTKPKPAPTSCPLTRSADPETWDACRAGYVAPKIEFAGLVSCVATDDTKKNWNLTYAFRLAGGNFKGADWSNSNGKTTILVKGYPIDGPGDTYPLIASVDVAMLPMNGLSGLIDMLSFSRTIDVPTGQFCK